MKIRDISLVISIIGIIFLMGIVLSLYLNTLIWLFIILILNPFFEVLGVFGTMIFIISIVLFAYGVGGETEDEIQ